MVTSGTNVAKLGMAVEEESEYAIKQGSIHFKPARS